MNVSKGGRYEKKKEAKAKKPMGGKKIALIIVCVVLVLIIAAVIAVVIYYNSVLNLVNRPGEVSVATMSDEELDAMLNNTAGLEVTEPEEETTEETTEPDPTWSSDTNYTNIMLVGQAAREGETYRLSDTMMLCTINREDNSLTLTSFQRDMRVVIPAYAGHSQGFNRMNVCYHLGSYWTGEVTGSMELLALAVEKNFGVHVDYTVEVDFEMFEKVVNVLGGVTLELTEDEVKYLKINYPYDFGDDIQPGTNYLYGYQALCYARIRKIDSDFKRTSRQRELLNILLDKCRTLDVATLHNLLTEVLPLVTTDMTNEEITSLALEVIPMLQDIKFVSQSVPFEGTYWSTNAGTEEVPDYVIDCNLATQKQMLLESLGMVESEE